MKDFAKNIFKKIIITCFILFNFFSVFNPTTVLAADDGATFGGELMKPVCSFIVGICDGVIQIIHRVVIGQNYTLVNVNLTESWVPSLFVILLGVIAVVGIVATFMVSRAAGIALILSVIKKTVIIGAVVAVTGTGAFVGGVLKYTRDAFYEEVDIPYYTVSPEEIFKRRN